MHSQYYHTIAVDLIGFGGSDKPPDIDYTIEKFVKFISEFINKKELNHNDRKITLVRHSLGESRKPMANQAMLL